MSYVLYRSLSTELITVKRALAKRLHSNLQGTHLKGLIRFHLIPREILQNELSARLFVIGCLIGYLDGCSYAPVAAELLVALMREVTVNKLKAVTESKLNINQSVRSKALIIVPK